jgi:hypothetical protein
VLPVNYIDDRLNPRKFNLCASESNTEKEKNRKERQRKREKREIAKAST